MDDAVSIERLAAIAERAVRAGGDYLAGSFRRGTVEGEYAAHDVTAVADREAEQRVLAIIEDAFPSHAIHAEESGRSRGAGDAEASYEWVVDPLDGTNNFASGLPSFATAVAVRRDGETLVSAIHEPLSGSLYLARRGEGATVNGEPLRADRDVSLKRGTVSLVVGLSAVRDSTLSQRARRIEDALRSECKRVLQTWSPCVDFGLLARGGIEGIVCFHPDPFEQYAGELLAAESGVRANSDGATYVAAADETALETLWEVVTSA